MIQVSARKLSVVRWPQGDPNSILVPPHPGCTISGNVIVASFHTHPNTGTDFLQEPSETDKRAVRDDPDLQGAAYVGEFVIAQETIYLITPDGQVREVADPQALFAQPEEFSHVCDPND
ncbi:MAG: hypothetical protein HY268_33190 [Deltaproteobacteria bacterium]|nr:hypothetical protein [Deltaproteobacteria bacterium]